MLVSYKKVLGKKSSKIIITFILLFLVLYAIPVPSVGEPVEHLVKDNDKLVEIEGIKVRYVEVQGEGNLTFVLLHGFGASVFSWREVIDNLSGYGRVIAFDRPGFGLTERVRPEALSFNPYTSEGQARVTYELLRKLNVTSAVLVGHSAGGGVAILLALEHPELVKALVLIAPAWKPYKSSFVTKIPFYLPLADKYGPLILRKSVGQLEKILYKAWYDKSKLTNDVVEGYKYPLRVKDWDKGLYWLMKYGGFPDITTSLSNIKAPVLIIHGENDEIVPLNSSLELLSLMSRQSNTQLVTIRECGHLPHEEKPEEFLAIIELFVKELLTNY